MSTVDKPKLKFIIFYDDGSQVEGDEFSVDSVKPFGVIAIVQDKRDGRRHTLSHKDYYVYINQQWVCLDTMGLVDHNVHNLANMKKVIVGRTIDNTTFWEIMDKAKTYV